MSTESVYSKSSNKSFPNFQILAPFVYGLKKQSSKENPDRNEIESVSSPPFLQRDACSPSSSFQKCNDRLSYKLTRGDSMTQQDLAAMSVLSLIDRSADIDKDMDTSRETDKSVSTGSTIEIDELQKQIIPNKSDEHETTPSEPAIEVCIRERATPDCETRCGFKCARPSIFFNDNKRSVDFVLVWDSLEPEAVIDEAQSRRALFEENLLKEGLELEYEPAEKNGLHFIKIHAPRNVLRFYSEVLKLRLPMKEELCKPPKRRRSRFYAILSDKILARQQRPRSAASYLAEMFNLKWKKVQDLIFIDISKFPERKHRFTAVYSRDKEYLFDVDSPCFFTPAIHSRIVQFILDRKRFSNSPEDDFAFGIERLLNEKVYSAAYPLHDGNTSTAGCMRNLLYEEWAKLNKWFRYQPLDYIKEYFGVKIALYFAWLGFYTHMLLPASIVGLLCFIYSCASLPYHIPSRDICEGKFNVTMCPQCDHFCDYWNIKQACLTSKISYLFDNSTTVFFAVFMSIWATTFLELWKRYSAEITHRWDLTGFDIQEEHPRPQYLARLSHIKQKQINIVTNTMEPLVPFWKLRLPFTIFSCSMVLLLIALAFATVAGVILYRMSVLTALQVYGSKNNSSYVTLFVTATAASINLICICIFNWIYGYLAEYLTELEFHRTQTQFDDSLTLKIYLLQFINYYASIFYIAFFKGKLIGHPQHYIKLFGYRQEECAHGGCLTELCIQLAIIMIGKQAMNSILEMSFPLFFKWMNTLKVKTGLQKGKSSTKDKPQWVKDFKLVQWGPRSLFPEYLEMVLQYGFITIFVSAFPLAPFFALLNNVAEMRLDARKLLVFYRRPITQRVKDIGVWYRILDSIGKLSVITNGFIIAFTSNFIPKFVYRVYFSKDQSLEGYLNFSMSYFKTRDFEDYYSERDNFEQVQTCRYEDYRKPPGTEYEYRLSSIYWYILAIRLAFVVIFENLVAAIIILIKWLIPDVPASLKQQIKRENFITNEIILRQEELRMRQTCAAPATIPQSESLPIVRHYTLGVGACPASEDDWEHIIDRSISEVGADGTSSGSFTHNYRNLIESEIINSATV